MAEGLNRATLLGHLGADGILRHTQSGTAVLNLRIATTERYQDSDGNWKDRTDWHNAVVWGKRGESIAPYCKKGKQMYIEGRLQTSSYDGRDGEKRYKTEINARTVLLLGSGERQQQPTGGGMFA